MAISRLDAGDAKRELVHVDLMELVATTTEQMRLVAEDAGISLEYADLQSVPVMGDRGRLQQVVVNLLDNAIKYTPRGGTVRLHTLRSGREGVLEIRDNRYRYTAKLSAMFSSVSIVSMTRAPGTAAGLALGSRS